MMARVEKLRELMKENNLQGFLVTSPYNLRYLTNFTGTTGLAMITLDKAFFVTDFRYTEQAAEQATGFTIVKNTGHIFDEVADLAERLQLDNLAFEETQVSFADYSLLEEILPCELVPVMGLIEELREVKDEEEVAIIEKACAIADQGFAFVLEMIKPGGSPRLWLRQGVPGGESPLGSPDGGVVRGQLPDDPGTDDRGCPAQAHGGRLHHGGVFQEQRPSLCGCGQQAG